MMELERMQQQTPLDTDPTVRLEHAQLLVQRMAALCENDRFVATIGGRRFPKVEWWTTVGAALGLFPREVETRRLDREDEIAYESVVEVCTADGRIITRASAICSSRERNWRTRDEYAIRSMALTRATGKAYRLGLSFLAALAGLETMPAEDMASDADDYSGAPDDEPATENQLKAIHAAMNRAGIQDRDSRLAFLSDVLGREIRSSREVRKSEVNTILRAIREITP